MSVSGCSYQGSAPPLPKKKFTSTHAKETPEAPSTYLIRVGAATVVLLVIHCMLLTSTELLQANTYKPYPVRSSQCTKLLHE